MATPYPDHPQPPGNFAPIRMECDIDADVLEGVRDPEPLAEREDPVEDGGERRTRQIEVAGDGMVHMFRIRDGRVRHRNRWGCTSKWAFDRHPNRDLRGPVGTGYPA